MIDGGAKMLHTGHVNFLSIIVASAAYWILGALWYSPIFFAKPWTKAIGKTREQLMEGFSKLAFLWSFVWSFVASYGIARIMVWTDAITIGAGFLVGGLVGICFVLATNAINNLFDRRGCTLLLINSLYHIVALVTAGVIISAWR